LLRVCAARDEILAEIRAILVDDPFCLVFAALIVVRRIVKVAVAADVRRAIAGRTRIAKANPLRSLTSIGRPQWKQFITPF